MDALTTLRTEINRLGFTPNEQDSLRKYFTENVEKINVVVSFLPDYATDDEKRGYLKSLISTPAGTSKSPNGLVFVFVDNSNLFIEGKYTVGNLEKAGTIDRKRGSFYFNELRFDHGCLLSTVMNGRRIGSDPVIVGSRPPPNDSLWKHIKSQGFKVVLYDRNVENKEKKIDTSLVVDGMKVITSKDPGVFVLIAGDGDYYPMVLEALYLNWKVEVWFWTSGISGDLLPKEEKSRLSFYPLDDCYRYFAYASGPNFEKKYVLEITDGITIKKWGDEQIMDCFVSLELFGWWNWEDETVVHLYFDDKLYFEKAKKWMEDKYSDIQVWEAKRSKSRRQSH
ncbi:15572_t:CDS:2 [Funneliformis geosporum]|uniref:12244_t:CDS:1 n=1 Tax=Funneliformis geosporum TaxID=1117311 RepID=A0A9W4T5P3_9GLOM|nr:15572_t:CDS:2 [Funneliformis geosporum]CAI2193479.1 12244_t:CDS:2 [Funneliformis geosporum]